MALIALSGEARIRTRSRRHLLPSGRLSVSPGPLRQGGFSLLYLLPVRPAAIASSAAVGSHTVFKALIPVAPAAIDRTPLFGTAHVKLGVAPNPVEQVATVGAHTVVQLFAVRVTVGVASNAAVASGAVVALEQAVAIDGVDNPRAVAAPLLMLNRVAPLGVASSAAVGSHAVVQNLAAVGAVASNAAVGTPHLKLGVAPAGVASNAAVGTPHLKLGVAPAGVASNAAVGSHTVSIPSDLDHEQTVATGETGLTVATTFDITIPAGGIGTGRRLVIALGHTDNAVTGASSAVDDAGNTWACDNWNNDNYYTALLSCNVTSALVENDIITVTFPNDGSVALTWALEEFSGVDATGAFDRAADGNGTGTSMNAGTTPGLSQDDELVVAMFFQADSPGGWTFTPGTGYTAGGVDGEANGALLGVEWKVVASSSAVSPVATSSRNATFAGLCVTYRG